MKKNSHGLDTAYVFATKSQFAQLPRFDEVIYDYMHIGGGDDFYGVSSKTNKLYHFIRVTDSITSTIILDLVKNRNKNDILCFLDINSHSDILDLAIKASETISSISLQEFVDRIDAKRDYTYDEVGWRRKQLAIFKEIGT